MKGMGADAFFETPVSQDTSIPVKQLNDKVEEALVKATFYLTQDHIMKLERIKLARKQKGKRIDKSALVREAIDLLSE
jgi:tartrate dehydratase alpha subunit/fumarate hydratase class I-like protein